MTPEELQAHREIEAVIKTMELKPTKYSREEIENAYIKQCEMNGYLIHEYGIDDTRPWAKGLNTGIIFYQEE
jgi:hypothetical protein